MEFAILGPLQALREGDPIDIGGPLQRVLLAMLVLSTGNVVSVTKLIEALWGDRPPETAKRQIHMRIHRLRRDITREGAEELIITAPPGYCLAADRIGIDLVRFDDLVIRSRQAFGAGNIADSAAFLRTALSMWRGPAAVGIESDVVQRAAVHLNEARVSAVACWIDLELFLGRFSEVISVVAHLAAEYPLRERFRVQHMLALYRLGRQADALHEYRLAWRVLVEQAGVEPCSDLQRLHSAILASEESLMTADLGGFLDLRPALGTRRGLPRMESFNSWGPVARVVDLY